MKTRTSKLSIFQYDPEYLHIFYGSEQSLQKITITNKSIDCESLIDVFINRIELSTTINFYGSFVFKNNGHNANYIYQPFSIVNKKFIMYDPIYCELYFKFNLDIILLTINEEILFVNFTLDSILNRMLLSTKQHATMPGIFTIYQILLPITKITNFYQDKLSLIISDVNGAVHVIIYNKEIYVYQYIKLQEQYHKNDIVLHVGNNIHMIVGRNIKTNTLLVTTGYKTTIIDDVLMYHRESDINILIHSDKIILVGKDDRNVNLNYDRDTTFDVDTYNGTTTLLLKHHNNQTVGMKKYDGINCVWAPVYSKMMGDSCYFLKNDQMHKFSLSSGILTKIENPFDTIFVDFHIYDPKTKNVKSSLITWSKQLDIHENNYWLLDEQMNKWVSLGVISQSIIQSALNLYHNDFEMPFNVTLMINPDFSAIELINIITAVDLVETKIVVKLVKHGKLISDGDGVTRDVFQKIIRWSLIEIFNEGAYLTFKKPKHHKNLYYQLGLLFSYYFITTKMVFPFRFPIQVLINLCYDRNANSNMMEFWKRISPDHYRQYVAHPKPSDFGYTNAVEMLKEKCFYQPYDEIKSFKEGFMTFLLPHLHILNPQTLDIILSGPYNHLQIYHDFFNHLVLSPELGPLRKFFLNLTLEQYRNLFSNWSSTWLPDGKEYTIKISENEPYFTFKSCLKLLDVSIDFLNSREEWHRLYKLIEVIIG